jgi:D-amino-acid dehydrogenase
MKVLVLGAGVIGTTCAYYLAKAGHEVTVIDRQPGPALETSFANAGGVCPSFAGPWAAPGMPLKAVRWLFAEHAPLMLRPRADLHQWRWPLAFLRNCTAERFARNKAVMQRIAHYSKACLVALREETGLAYDHGTGGVLQIFRTEEEVEAGARAAAVLKSFGVPHRIVDVEAARAIEPALARDVPLAGGLHLPADETGDCHLFTGRLTELLRRRGVTFQFGTKVERLVADGGRLDSVVTSTGTMRTDATVVALASEAPFLLRPIGIDLPIYPVRGYAVTFSIGRDDAAPRSSVMDEHSKVMITRLGNRIRAAGVAEVGGYDRTAVRRQCEMVAKVAKELFPAAATADSSVEYWAGLRPMTPDGPPYLGRTTIANLFLNVGQGSNGWTQACGCGRIVADLVSGRQPDIDMDGFRFNR